MIIPPPPPDGIDLALPGDIAIVHCAESFVFQPGNRLRAATCLVCKTMIGGEAAAIVGAAALAGEPCVCGGVASDVFLIHHTHLPLPEAVFRDVLRRGLECTIHRF